MTRLCLNMIVKNEVANLERCLGSIVDHIACWVIGDTGSSDGTPEMIQRFFDKHDIPGELHSFDFENFGYARNRALDLARASSLSFDYLLFADADMELRVAAPDFADGLTAEVYQVRQDSGVAYWNTRLLRRDAPARYVGVTHEYLDLRAGETRQLDSVSYIDHASGANRPGKFARDAALLSKALETEEDPGLRARYTFYLANSLRDDGDHAGALEQYLERSRLGQWREEVFLSLHNAAEMKIALGHPVEEVFATFEDATAACPTRAEALHGAAVLCRSNKQHERGYQYASRGAAMPVPRAGLFVAEWVYAYGLLDELAVAAYWSGRYGECVNACDKMLAEPSLPAGFRPRVTQNRQFAVDRLKEQVGTKQTTDVTSAIPKIFHFITGLDKDFGGKGFSFIHAMAIWSALRVNEGFVARVYFEYEPQGPYWDLVKPHITRVPIVAPREFCGHPIEHFAHRADICRIRILLEHGGIYLDMDTICQKPFAPLLDGAVVMGLEKTSDGTMMGLCNATIIAPPNAAFLKLWLDTYADFKVWNQFSVQRPMLLADQHPDLVRIEPHTSFFWPPWDDSGIAALFVEDHAYPDAYSFHLWESKSWGLVKDHDAEHVARVDTSYNRVARRFSRDLSLRQARLRNVYDALGLLTPYDIDLEKRLVGGDHDGAYVVADTGSQYDVLSIGIGYNDDFDHQCAEAGHRIFMFDHTVDAPPRSHEKYTFHKYGICGVNRTAPDCKSLQEILDLVASDARMILKMDVEGAEWDVFSSTSDAVLSRFDQILVEVHWLENIQDAAFRALFCASMEHINRQFTLFHVHANNYRNITIVDGLPVAGVLELSFVKTELVERRQSSTIFPSHLDNANDKSRRDLPLLFYPFLPMGADRSSVGEMIDRIEHRFHGKTA